MTTTTTWTKVSAGKYTRGEYAIERHNSWTNGYQTPEWHVYFRGNKVNEDTYLAEAKKAAEYHEAQFAKGLVDAYGNAKQPQTREAVLAPLRDWVTEELASAKKAPGYSDSEYYRNEGKEYALEMVLDRIHSLLEA